jgi:hypothetical protein
VLRTPPLSAHRNPALPEGNRQRQLPLVTDWRDDADGVTAPPVHKWPLCDIIHGFSVQDVPKLIQSAEGRFAGLPETCRNRSREVPIFPVFSEPKASGAVSLRQLAAGLNERGIPIARGGDWSVVQVQRVMERVLS